jgi:membrane-associated protein
VIDLDAIMQSLRDLYDAWGYPVIFLGALLENTILLGFLLPGGSLVMLGAVYAQQGTLALPLVLLAGWTGMVVGASFDYLLGRWGLHALATRTHLLSRVSHKLDRAEDYLNRYGMWTFLVAHFIGHIRSFVAITAGATRLPYRQFLLFEATAALVWNVLFVLGGYLLGSNIERLQQIMGSVGLVIVALLFSAYAAYRLVRRFQRRQAAPEY